MQQRGAQDGWNQGFADGAKKERDLFRLFQYQDQNQGLNQKNHKNNTCFQEKISGIKAEKVHPGGFQERRFAPQFLDHGDGGQEQEDPDDRSGEFCCSFQCVDPSKASQHGDPKKTYGEKPKPLGGKDALLTKEEKAEEREAAIGDCRQGQWTADEGRL